MLTGIEWQQVCRNSSEDSLVQILSSSTMPSVALYAAQAELVRRASAPPYPATDKWRAELAAGLRKADTFDDLWRAACNEMNEREWNAILSRRPPSPNHPPLVDDDLPF